MTYAYRISDQTGRLMEEDQLTAVAIDPRFYASIEFAAMERVQAWAWRRSGHEVTDLELWHTARFGGRWQVKLKAYFHRTRRQGWSPPQVFTVVVWLIGYGASLYEQEHAPSSLPAPTPLLANPAPSAAPVHHHHHRRR